MTIFIFIVGLPAPAVTCALFAHTIHEMGTTEKTMCPPEFNKKNSRKMIVKFADSPVNSMPYV